MAGQDFQIMPPLPFRKGDANPRPGWEGLACGHVARDLHLDSQQLEAQIPGFWLLHVFCLYILQSLLDRTTTNAKGYLSVRQSCHMPLGKAGLQL